MSAAGLRRWTEAGRELRQRDPGRYRTLLHLAEMALRAHRQIERSGHDLAVKVRRVADVAADVGRPRTRQDWGQLAIAAAERAGLPEPDLESLETNLEDQWRIDQHEHLKRGDTVQLPASAGGGVATVHATRYGTIPAQLIVCARGGKRQTIQADLVTPVGASRRAVQRRRAAEKPKGRRRAVRR